MKTQNIKVPLIDIKEACCSNDKTAMDCIMMSISAARLEDMISVLVYELHKKILFYFRVHLVY